VVVATRSLSAGGSGVASPDLVQPTAPSNEMDRINSAIETQIAFAMIFRFDFNTVHLSLIDIARQTKDFGGARITAKKRESNR
jgi:hypothetical protein